VVNAPKIDTFEDSLTYYPNRFGDKCLLDILDEIEDNAEKEFILGLMQQAFKFGKTSGIISSQRINNEINEMKDAFHHANLETMTNEPKRRGFFSRIL